MVTASKDITTTNANPAIANPGGRVAAKLAGGLVLWLRARYTRHELMRLNDRALADIGTTGHELSAFAKQSDPWRQLPRDAVAVLALGALIERLESWRGRRRREAQTYRELMAYSDAELTDLGISRRDIGEIARSGGRPSPA
jgi:uncharacterized protein YjiS (DUF1127 family)